MQQLICCAGTPASLPPASRPRRGPALSAAPLRSPPTLCWPSPAPTFAGPFPRRPAARAAPWACSGRASARAMATSDGSPAPARGVVFIATSLDGYIARKDGAIDWLDAANATVTDPTQDMGFGELMASVQCMIMGRNTYDTVAGMDQWPYGDTRVVVLSRTPEKVAIRPENRGTVSASGEEPAALMARLGAEGVRAVYIDGGSTIRAFLAAGLVDKLTLTTIPVLLGSGIPLFGGGGPDVKLKHVSTSSYDWGFVQSTYEVVRE